MTPRAVAYPSCPGCLGPDHTPKMNYRYPEVNSTSASTASLTTPSSPKKVKQPVCKATYESASSFEELSAPPTATAETRAVHVIVANALGVGHYTPVVNLVQLLLSRSASYMSNLRLTFISPVRASESKGSPPPQAHPHLHFVRVVLEGPDVHPINMAAMLTRREELQEHLVEALRHTNEELGWPKPVALIHDMFAVYAQEYADDVLNIPRVLFNPSHAMVFSLLWKKEYKRALWSDEGIVEIPGFHRVARLNMLWAMLNSGESDPVLEGSDLMGIVARSIALVSNDLPTVLPYGRSLTEGVNVEIQRMVEKRDSITLQPIEFFPIAPLCMLQPPQPPREHDQLMSWLDQQAPRSVIYIALGTLYDITPAALRAMAAALEISMRPFLWAYRLEPKGVVTEEFKKRVAKRARVASWVDQRAVLGHPAIRVFITHGGWNSCVESFAFGGVPMICVPLGSEQAVNGMLLSDALGIGEVALMKDEKRRPELSAAEREALANSAENTKGPLDWPLGLQNSWWRSCSCEEWLRLLKRVCDTEYEELSKRASLTHIQTLKACAPQGQMMQSADGLIALLSNLSS